MLTSSPIAPRSTSASPRTFHYAPHHSLSPHLSPKVTANLPRRHSKHSVVPSQSANLGSSSLKSPPPPQSQSQQGRPKQYVGVDAATQYSPMEPFDPTVPVLNARPPPPSEALPSSSAAVASSAAAVEAARYSSSTPAEASTLIQSLSATPKDPPEPNLSPKRPDIVASVANPLSPAKRRNSQDLASATPEPGSSSAAATSKNGKTKSSPKRSRTEQGPAKLLPLKYEFCDVEDMVVLIANMLSELIETNDSLAMKSGHLTRFHSR